MALSSAKLSGSSGVCNQKQVKLFENTFRPENSYAVQAEALKAIGKCGGKQQPAFLNKARNKKSYGNVVGKAATDAIAMIEYK